MTIRSAQRTVTVTLAVLCFAGLAAPALAKPKQAAEASAAAPAKKKAVALPAFEGKKNAEVRGWVREVIQKNFECTDAEDFKVKSDPASVAKMAQDLGVEGVVLGKLEKKSLTISVFDGSDGRMLAQIEIKQPPGPKMKKIIAKKLGDKLYGAFGLQSPAEIAKKQAEAKQEAEEAGATDEGDEAPEGGEAKTESEAPAEGEASAEGSSEGASSESDAGPTGPIPSPLELRAGIGASKRDFVFHDTLTSATTPTMMLRRALRDYHGGLDLSLVLRGEVYPSGFLKGQGFINNVGIVLGFEYALPTTTLYKNNQGEQLELKNSAQEVFVGAKVRVPLSDTMQLGFLGTFGQQKYVLKGDELFALVPDVVYNYVRPALQLRMRTGRIGIEAELGARLVLDTGELERADIWFRNVGGFGVDASANVSFAITPKISAFVGGRLTRYGFDFNPIDPADPVWINAGGVVAGGATDTYMGAILGASFRLPDKE